MATLENRLLPDEKKHHKILRGNTLKNMLSGFAADYLKNWGTTRQKSFLFQHIPLCNQPGICLW